MPRSASPISGIAILAVIGYVILSQLTAFVNSSPSHDSRRLRSRASPHGSSRLRSRVSLGPFKQEIAAAEKQVSLLAWAVDTASKKGMPEANMLKQKLADESEALEILKQKQEGAGSESPMVSASAISALMPTMPEADPCPVPVSMAGVTKEEIKEAEKHANLLLWAAETALRKGMPQASIMQTKALAAVKALEDLKACAEDDSPEPAPVAAAPVASAPAPVAAAPAASEPVSQEAPAAVPSVSKEEFLAAKKQADLLVWAAEVAASKGMPQAAMLQANADAALAKTEAMSEALA